MLMLRAGNEVLDSPCRALAAPSRRHTAVIRDIWLLTTAILKTYWLKAPMRTMEHPKIPCCFL